MSQESFLHVPVENHNFIFMLLCIAFFSVTYIIYVTYVVLNILLSLNKSKQGSKVVIYTAVEPPKQSGNKLASLSMIINNTLVRNEPMYT